MKFDQCQRERYARNIALRNVGLEGQTRIANAKVLVIGAGGLGSPVLLYLAAAGVGTIGVADGDVVDLSNLQRQIIHSTSDVNRSKVASAGEKINTLNPDVTVIEIPNKITATTILGILKEYHYIIDATDSFSSKFLINDACVIGRKPYSHSGVMGFHGQILTVLPGKSACYRCIFPEVPSAESLPSAKEIGILGAVAGILGTLQATECLKYILGIGNLLTDRLLTVDALGSGFNEIRMNRNPECPVCGDNPTIQRLTDLPY